MIHEGFCMKRAVVLALPALLAACTGTTFAPLEGMPAALGETVRVGSLQATPRVVIEDSRCPAGVRCIHTGQLVVSTQVAGEGWSETVPLTEGQPFTVQGRTITLVSGRPAAFPERRPPRNEYRFVFAGGA